MTRFLSVTVVALVGLLTAGCSTIEGALGGGVGGLGADPTQIVASAAANTTGAGSARFAGKMDLRPGEELEALGDLAEQSGTPAGPADKQLFGGESTMVVEGVHDYANDRGTFTVTNSRAGQTSEPATIITIGSVTYTKGTGLGGKDWLKYNASQPAEGDTSGAAPVAPQQNTDLTQAVAWLDGATDVTEVGQEQVRDGDTATHYQATLDLRAAASKQAPEAAAEISQIFDQMGVDTVPANVWVDDQGRMRQLEYTVKPGGPLGKLVSEMNVVLEMWDFGVEVNVQEPSASEVADLDEVTEQITGGLGG